MVLRVCSRVWASEAYVLDDKRGREVRRWVWEISGMYCGGAGLGCQERDGLYVGCCARWRHWTVSEVLWRRLEVRGRIEGVDRNNAGD